MIVEHSGWEINKRTFCDKYFVDETKINYEIHWKNGSVSKQVYPFKSVTRDWNNDDDIYTLFVAGFEGQYGGIDWWTPQQLVGLIVSDEATVSGIKKL